MSDTILINDISINGQKNTPDSLSKNLQDNTVNALGVDASSRTIWVNGQPYGNAYVNVNADNTIDAPLGAEIFNDFEHNVASGEYSHASGRNTIASAEAEHVVGKYNDNSKPHQFSVGIGTSDSDRKNAFEVDSDGDSHFTGDIVIDGLGDADSGNNDALIENSIIVAGSGEGSGVMKGARNSATGKNALAIGQDNEAISENSVAMGSNNIAGLKGFYYKNVKSATNPKLYNIYVTKTQTTPQLNATDFTVEKDIDLTKYYEVGDILTIINDTKYENCCRLRSFLSVKGKGTIQIELITDINPFKNGIADMTEDNIDIEDFSIYCVNKPLNGISVLSHSCFVGGHDNMALSSGSFACGKNNNAFGKFAFATGRDNEAGYSAHAEGRNNKALRDNAHAEGRNTIASANEAHAEGYNTTANGRASHAEGWYTIAEGQASHAEGDHTIVTNRAEHAQGKFNASNTNTIHSVGIGTSEIRKNAHEILSTGEHYIYNLGGYDGTNPTDSKDIVTILSTVDTSDTSSFNVEKALNVDGATTLNGSVTLGNADADKIKVGGPATFSNAVTMANRLKVNGTTTLSKKLTVSSGGAEISGATTLNGPITLGDAEEDDIIVNGTTNFKVGVDIDKTLNVDGATTLNGPVTLGDAEGDDIIVNGDTNFKEAVDIDKILNVDGATTIGGTLTVEGKTTVSTLQATGATTMEGTLTVEGATTLNGSVTLGNADADIITVGGPAKFAKPVTITNILKVNEATTLGKKLTVSSEGAEITGDTTLKNNLHVYGDVTLGDIEDDIIETVTVNGILTVNDTTVLQDLVVTSGLNLEGDSSIFVYNSDGVYEYDINTLQYAGGKGVENGTSDDGYVEDITKIIIQPNTISEPIVVRDDIEIILTQLPRTIKNEQIIRMRFSDPGRDYTVYFTFDSGNPIPVFFDTELAQEFGFLQNLENTYYMGISDDYRYYINSSDPDVYYEFNIMNGSIMVTKIGKIIS